MSLQVPIPINNIEIVWLLIGMAFGRSFGKKFDYAIQQSKLFKESLSPGLQVLVKMILDFTHHWEIGAIIWLYAHLWVRFLWPSLLAEITWFGVGLFLDDIRDFRHVLDRYKKLVEPTKPPG